MSKENKSKKSGSVWRRFRRNKPAMVGLVILTVLLLITVSAGFIVDYETQVIRNNARERLQAPSGGHLFGTDNVGRDVFARVIYGGRYSLSIAFITTAVSMAFGAIVGSACGYYGGLFDSIVMRIMDVLNSLPGMLLTLAIVAALGANYANLLLAMIVSTLSGFVRLIRSTVIALSDVEYIQAARSYGSSDFGIIIKHVMPNAMGVIIVNAAGSVSNMILAAAALSFLGFGVQPPLPEWGVMLSDAKTYMRQAPWCMIAPGVFIMLSALSINLMGDGLRDALDPRLKD